MSQRLVAGITGASGAIYGVRLLERCKALGVETHLVVTPAEIQDLSVLPTTTEISGPVKPRTANVGVGQKGQRGRCRIVQISRGHARTADHDLSGRAVR